MALTFELATFTVREGEEATLLAERPQMIASLGRAFPGVLGAWLAKRDDGSWVDVSCGTAARKPCTQRSTSTACRWRKRGSDASQSHMGCSMSRSLTMSCSDVSVAQTSAIREPQTSP
jgi:hypothetical protein